MSGGLYLRVIHERAEQDPARDLPELEALVAACGERFEGVGLSDSIQPHARGGYKLFLDCRIEDREGVVLFLRAQGWLSVI
tara:strand:+ start:2556 stop:2798 length:243 start_codon:yes stop_codon:yes gene_type:complete